MIVHEQVLRDYVDSVEAVAALFGTNFKESVTYKEFSISMLKEILTTTNYITSVKD